MTNLCFAAWVNEIHLRGHLEFGTEPRLTHRVNHFILIVVDKELRIMHCHLLQRVPTTRVSAEVVTYCFTCFSFLLDEFEKALVRFRAGFTVKHTANDYDAWA